jgi:hypothetical protein
VTFGALADLLVEHSATADDCWFCIWEGYGWEQGSHFVVYSRLMTGDPALDEDPERPVYDQVDLLAGSVFAKMGIAPVRFQ